MTASAAPETSTALAANWATLWSVLAGLGLWFLPANFIDAARGGLHDVLRPGCQLTGELQDHWSAWRASQHELTIQELQRELETTRSALGASEAHVRRLVAQAADRQQTQSLSSVGPFTGPPRLFRPAVIEAAVLGQTLSHEWRTGRLLDRGHRHGVRESAVVLSSRAPLLDVGLREQVQPEDTVFAGRTILGKVAAVGRWTSTYLPVTDAAYRGRAQLVRRHGTEWSWGSSGLLSGTGKGCVLTGVSIEHPVADGDLVFSAEQTGGIDDALYFGHVAAVTAGGDDHEWTIAVNVTEDHEPRRASILRAALNPLRLDVP